MNLRGAIIVGFPLVVLLGTALVSYDRLYASQVSERSAELSKLRSGVEQAERILAERRSIAERRDRLTRTLLGTRQDEVEHELRTRLTALARQAGLSEVVVSSGAPQPASSPVLRARASRELSRELRRAADFAVIEARLVSVGTLRQTLRALATIEAQPWAHRVGGVSVRPVGSDREKVQLRVDVATLLVTWGRGVDPSELESVEPVPSMIARADALAASGMFVRQVVAVPEPPRVEPVRRPEPRPAYDKWRVAGVAEGTRLEAWVVHVSTGESRVLGVGDAVLGATLLTGSREVAIFELDGERVEVRVGDTLADRKQRSQ